MKMFGKLSMAAGAALVLMGGNAAMAQTVVLPDNSQTTTLTATVSEQAQVSVPAGVTFNVTNVGVDTAASGASVSASSIVLSTATKKLKVSIQANAATFSAPVGGAVTWSASDVTWNASSWTNATGASGSLSNSSYNEVATCDADASDCSTSGLTFTLGAKNTVKRSGNHTLSVTWKFESI
jgi:hypothetical protein